MMSVLRLLLLPFAWLFGLVLSVRHVLYDRGWLKSTTPDMPTIAIGNIDFCGPGKTPHL